MTTLKMIALYFGLFQIVCALSMLVLIYFNAVFAVIVAALLGTFIPSVYKWVIR